MRIELHRRTLLRGMAGVALPLPWLEAMGDQPADSAPRRFCAVYTANGMSLPRSENEIDDWRWFPEQTGSGFEFGQSVKPLEPFRDNVSFIGGLHHPNGIKADPHTCSDMWLTGAALHNPKRGTYNSVSLDQVVATHTKKYCRQPSLVLSIDAGVGFLSRTGTISFNRAGKPIPAENNPRRVFERLFRSSRESLEQQRRTLSHRVRIVDAVIENSRSLSRQLGQSDREKLDQYLTSLAEVEARLEASEKWMDVPIKQQDYSQLDLGVTNEGDPAEYYRTMFDLIALAFEADITRSVAFMLNREDGMGISDTFPLKLGLHDTHHQLSHATERRGQLEFAKYDRFLAQQLAYFMTRLTEFRDDDRPLLDNTIMLYGSGASTTHNPRNLPTLVAGGRGMGLEHGTFWRDGETRMSNLHLSILRALKIPTESFSDSTGILTDAVFGRV